ncbi:MAG: BMP family ABC transporter substrate-binding protein [Sphaerochaeta sp.]|nr:BMP family ABC transporter substrate-binding protein [Sphaerochaeta sp.]
MKKTVLLLLVLLLSLSFGFARANTEKHSDEKIRIALIGESTVDDGQWFESMYSALLQVQQRRGDIIVSLSEKQNPVAAGTSIMQFIAQGYDIIIAHGAQYANIVKDLAPNYPSVIFAYGTGEDTSIPNVFTYTPKSEETGYLNGIAAGLGTKTNVIGLIGSVDGGDAARYDRGFVLGVRSVNPKADVRIVHTGTFTDYIRSSQMAHLYVRTTGADMLSGSSQQAKGALRAIEDYPGEDIFWLGVDPNSPKVLAAQAYNWVPMIDSLLENKSNGIRGGVNLSLSFENGGFFYTIVTDQPEIRDALNKAKGELERGTLSIDWKSVKL